MKININELKNSADSLIIVDFDEKIAALNSQKPVKASLEVAATPYGVSIKGHARAELTLECDRCLGEYFFPVDVTINEDFFEQSFVPADAKDYELSAGQFGEELCGREDIDLDEFLYQLVILEEPTQKICNPSCEGSKQYQEFKQKMESEKNIDERLEVFKTFSENNFGEN